MATAAADRFVLNIHHPEIMRGVLERVLATGDVLGQDRSGRIVLAVAIEPWLFDALAEFGTDLEEREPDPDEDDGL
jgi:hypothetical protein